MPQIILNGPDPGDTDMFDDIESNLDIEWAGAVAKNANIVLVTSQSTASTDGILLSAEYAVFNNVAPIISVSYGECEQNMGHELNQYFNIIWGLAAAQGITVIVSSGDSGPDDGVMNDGISAYRINGLASTLHNTAVGGTMFNEGGSMSIVSNEIGTEMVYSNQSAYWSSTNNSKGASALGYIPEVAWNESSVSGILAASGYFASGGGYSSLYAKPYWQVAPVVQYNTMRSIPDVSLAAGGIHDGYVIWSSLGYPGFSIPLIVGGTSAAAPSFAGIMAIVVQLYGRQGNINPSIYQLGMNQYVNHGAQVFHDITSGNTNIPGVTGYYSGQGYDMATGLGSINGFIFVANFGNVTGQKLTCPGGSTWIQNNYQCVCPVGTAFNSQWQCVP